MTIQPAVGELLFNKANYVKKLIEDNNSEETTKLLKVSQWYFSELCVIRLVTGILGIIHLTFLRFIGLLNVFLICKCQIINKMDFDCM